MKVKLPFDIQLERKYNDINVENFIYDWAEYEEERRNRIISMSNDLHIELGKFNTYNITLDEIIDVGLRYALSKREFRTMMAEIIAYKK